MKSDNLNISFTGESRNSIDQKNRLSIPAKYRKALSPVNNNTFVLTRGFDQCLILYPLDEWKKVEGQLGSLSSIKVPSITSSTFTLLSTFTLSWSNIN